MVSTNRLRTSHRWRTTAEEVIYQVRQVRDIDSATTVYIPFFKAGRRRTAAEQVVYQIRQVSKVREDVITGYEFRDGNTIVSLKSSIDIRGVMIELTGEQADEPVRLVDRNFELLYHRKNSQEARLGLVDLSGPSIIKAGTHQLVRFPDGTR